MTKIPIPPASLRPADGRFGAGPSKIRPEQLEALASASQWGTSHRKAPVMDLVKGIQSGLRDLFEVPGGYEIVLGNGGATAFWAIAANSLIRDWGNFAAFGEFGAKFAADARSAPWLNVTVEEAPAGQLAQLHGEYASALGSGPDTHCYPQNETSTGVASPIYRPAGPDALTLVDATSIAGASVVDLSLVDAYYFSPQKCFGADGGLWVAILSPAAVARASQLAKSPTRPHFGFLNLEAAIKASRKGQTVNTPAIGTLLLVADQLEWMLENGGLPAMAARAKAGADLVAAWAEQRPWADLFVKEERWRSPVVTTVDIDPRFPVPELAAALREAGIVDVEGYRGLGRNQLRLASFPSIDTSDLEAALACIDWTVENS